jgi:ribosomal protein S18 acetylase RimI-like enzyme
MRAGSRECLPTDGKVNAALEIVVFDPRHIDAARGLWARTEGVGLSAADEVEPLGRYLARNPRTSFVALKDGTLAGTLLCGHDGRRGLLHHLAVADECRRSGLGRRLVEAGLKALRDDGIQKCHLMVFADNPSGLAFWAAIGAQRRDELQLLSLSTA